jgi:cytochrome c-type biogenesis protein CcmH/NrfG
MAKPTSRSAKVIVTPRMLQAGAIALAAMGDVSEYELVGSIYRAMAAVAPPAATAAAKASPPDNFLEVMRLMGAGKRDV